MGFFKTEGKIRFDELINEKIIYPQDFDKEKLNTFLELARPSKTLSPEKILTYEPRSPLPKGRGMNWLPIW